MAKLPKAVQQQLEQAEAVQAQLANQEQVAVVTDASQLVAPPTPEPQAPAPVAPPPAPVDTTNWEAKAKTLEGMLRTEVPNLRTQLLASQSQVAQLMGQVETLKSQLSTRPADPEPAPKPTVDPRDIEQFGSDMMDMVQRYVTGAVAGIKADVAKMTGTIESRVASLEQAVKGVSQKAEASLDSQFWTLLKELVPDYEDVNERTEWLAWLKEVDPLTGVERQHALAHAQKSLDARRVAAIFNLFKKELPPPPAAALASQVSPGTGGAAPAVATPSAPQLISEKFINDFYRDVQKGKYVGREAEAQRIEHLIHQAASQGRIVK